MCYIPLLLQKNIKNIGKWSLCLSITYFYDKILRIYQNPTIYILFSLWSQVIIDRLILMWVWEIDLVYQMEMILSRDKDTADIFNVTCSIWLYRHTPFCISPCWPYFIFVKNTYWALSKRFLGVSSVGTDWDGVLSRLIHIYFILFISCTYIAFTQ